MNDKQVKKLRKMYRKEMQGIFNSVIKPKPKWIPAFVWLWLIKKMLNI